MVEENNSKLKGIVTKLALFLFLVVLPAGSWYFLNTGANFYRGVMAELGDYGTLPEIEAINTDSQKVDSRKYDKSLTIVGIRNESSKGKNIGMMNYVYEQFKDNPGVLFLTINTNQDTDFDFNSYSKQHQIDIDKWSFIHDSDFERKITLKEEHPILEHFMLVDTNRLVRNYFSFKDTSSVNRMIVTMSLLMPRPPKADIIYSPEQEK